MNLIKEFLAQAVEAQASDVHLKPGQPPIYRLQGQLAKADAPAVTVEDIQELVEEILSEEHKVEFHKRHEIDFAWNFRENARFRVNLFRSGGEPTLALRYVKNRIPSFEELNLPEILKQIALSERGIVLMGGTTGSGKSTTLAAMIQWINTHDFRRIITIENPIEYVFRDENSIISQREVGLDTVGFHTGLKNALRQDPDVVMIGEIRDRDSVATAMGAAETGHMIFSTIHIDTAAQAVNRILDLFPAEERTMMRMVLASTIKAVICQRLVPDVRGRVRPALEIMISTPIVRKLITEENNESLSTAIETGGEDGMCNFNQSLYAMYKAGHVDQETALMYASNPETLKMNFKGIFLDNSKRIVGRSR
jgi:twitching motility protein PilT